MSGGTLVQNTAERTDIADGTAVTTNGANTGGAAGTQLGYTPGAVTSKAYFSTVNPYAGTRAYRIDLISGEVCYLQLAGTAAATARARWYMRFESLPTVNEWVATVRSASANTCHFKVTTAGRLETISASGGQITLGASTLPTATWIWVETRVTPGTSTTGVIEVSWGTAGNAATETFATVSNANLGTAQVASVRVGRTQAVSAANSVKYDEIAYEANPTGPIGPVAVAANAAPTAGISSSASTVEAGEPFTLTLTEGDDVAVTTRTFRQVSGPTATVTGTGLTRAVTAPATLAGGSMVFGYQTGDAGGLTSTEATTTVTVLPASRRLVTAGGPTPTLVPMLRRIAT